MVSFRKVTAFLFLLILISQATLMADSESVKGIYSLMRGMQSVEPSVLQLPFVAGVSIRASWEAIEPEEGKFQWSYLDDALREVKKAKKKAMLRVLPGVHSPIWISQKGVKFLELKDENKYHKTYGQMMKMPLPWDETYIREWIKFIYTLGKRYGSDDTLVLVHMAGPTVNSAEMHLPKRGEGRRLIEDAGYSKEKLVEAWGKVIDAYSDAFPKKALALNIAVPLRKDDALEEVIKYGVTKLGKRLCVQGNWLSGHTGGSFHPYELMTNLKKSNNVIIGFQMLAPSADKDRQGSLEVSIQRGLDAGASYFEIYEADILGKSNRQLLEELDKKLK